MKRRQVVPDPSAASCVRASDAVTSDQLPAAATGDACEPDSATQTHFPATLDCYTTNHHHSTGWPQKLGRFCLITRTNPTALYYFLSASLYVSKRGAY